MSGAYGLPYQGSKNSIARWIVDILPASGCLVDLFAGGCAVTHAALESGKWERVIANDRLGTPALFEACCKGEAPAWDAVVSREEFMALRDVDSVVSLVSSFGSNQRDYAYGKSVETTALLAERMLTGATVDERYTFFKAFMKDLYQGGALSKKSQLRRLENVRRLKRLENVQRVERLEIMRGDYRDVPIPAGSTVYADPPYRGTNTKAYGEFNFGAFDAWLASVDFPVFVSEYTAPAGCVEIARVEKTCTMSATNNSLKRIEKIFVQERFYSEVCND